MVAVFEPCFVQHEEKGALIWQNALMAAALAPFLLLGAWQSVTLENLEKTRILERRQNRAMTWLIRGLTFSSTLTNPLPGGLLPAA